MKFMHHPLKKIIYSSLIHLPSPMNISYMWNFGSMLGIALSTQILSGLFLAMHYTPETMKAFDSIIHISRDVNLGWLMRLIHMNGASLFFIFMFMHIGRGIYYESFIFKETWLVGILIFLLSMASAFLGYVLPWGQMSFWGATVITNLMSAVPYIGQDLVHWIWGGFSVQNSTLNRFFVFHFILPFIVLIFVILHLFFLHMSGSNNPLGISSKTFKIPFTPYFLIKDILGFVFMFICLVYIISFEPYTLGDPDNFSIANPMSTPTHIKPEWYFLFAYAILRSIPSKLGGVIALLMSILILGFLPFLKQKKQNQSNQFNFKPQIIFWHIVITFLLLTWIGAKPVEDPYIIIGQMLTMIYFFLFIETGK